MLLRSGLHGRKRRAGHGQLLGAVLGHCSPHQCLPEQSHSRQNGALAAQLHSLSTFALSSSCSGESVLPPRPLEQVWSPASPAPLTRAHISKEELWNGSCPRQRSGGAQPCLPKQRTQKIRGRKVFLCVWHKDGLGYYASIN